MKGKTSKSSTLVVVTLTAFVTPFMMSAVSIALPAIGKDFAAHAVLLSWVATSYILAGAVFLIPVGRLADIYGRRRVFVSGLALFFLSTLASGLTPSAHWLIAVRIVQGMGGAMIATTGTAIITSVFPPNERGKVIGIQVGAVYSGLSVGPFVGGLLTQQLGWRAVFLCTSPFALVALVIAIFMLKDEWADSKGDKFDITGSIYYGLSLIALLYGASILPNTGGLALLVIGVAGMILFVRHVSRVEHPVFDIRLFRDNRTFAFSNLAAFIHYTATFGVTFLLSLFLQHIKGMTPQQAGLVLLCQPVMQALFAPFAGRFSDRIEPRIIASTGMAITSAGLFLLVFVGEETSIVYIAATLAFLGMGYGMFTSPNTNAIMSSVERKHYGIASGSVSTMRTVGMSASMAVVTLVFAVLIGQAEIAPESYPEFSSSVRLALGIFATVCLIGIVPSLVRGKIRT